MEEWLESVAALELETEEQASRKTFEDCDVLVARGGYILVFGLSG